MEVRRPRGENRVAQARRAAHRRRLNSNGWTVSGDYGSSREPGGPALKGIFLLDRRSLLMEGGCSQDWLPHVIPQCLAEVSALPTTQTRMSFTTSPDIPVRRASKP